MKLIKIVTGSIIALGGLFVFGSYMVLKASQFHRNYLRDKVGSKVIMITDDRGGGTGFAIKTSKGKDLILTNSHICDMSENGKYLNTNVNGVSVRLDIIKKSKTSDLCLVSNPLKIKGLSMSDGLKIGEELAIVGHPMLYPLSLSRGEFLGYTEIQIVTKMLSSYSDKCETDEKEVPTIFGTFCLKSYDSGITNAIALGGNSGSPVVNFYGEVVGVLFAANNRSNWGIIVPLRDVEEFLRTF
jgi:S1-C subfamily serine protease